MDILSVVVSILSIILGIYAIVQAKRYNKESEKINEDTRKILNLQLEEIQTIERKIVRDLTQQSENIEKICMAKDGGCIYKLSTYDKNNSDAVIKIFQALRVKESVLKVLKNFLVESKDEKFCFDFWNMAEARDHQNIRRVKEELEQYGILLIIDYQARPLKS